MVEETTAPRRLRAGAPTVRYGILVMLAALLALGLSVSISRVAPRAQAAGGCGTTQACIHWSSDMIYAGKNNGYPEGPVGEHALVNGEGFTAYAGQQISLRLVQGDMNSAPDSPEQYCKFKTPRVDGVATAKVDGAGSLSATFDWPVAAGSGDWSICAIGPDGLPAGGNIDDGPFYVISNQAPSLVLSATSVMPGGAVTVTGHNWLPGQGQIFVYAGPCADCGATPLAYQTVASNASGDFTATLTFSASAQPGSYLVAAHNETGVLDTLTSGPHITVAQAATATAMSTATSMPTATTASSGGVSSVGGKSGGSSSSSSPAVNAALIPAFAIGGGALVLALLAVGAILWRARGSKLPTPGASPEYPDGSQGNLAPPTYMPGRPDDITVPLMPPGNTQSTDPGRTD